MKNFLLFKNILILLLFVSFISCEKHIEPNVVLIMVDDMNDYPEVFNGHPQAKTPSINKLSDSATSFLSIFKRSHVWSLKSKYDFGSLST